MKGGLQPMTQNEMDRRKQQEQMRRALEAAQANTQAVYSENNEERKRKEYEDKIAKYSDKIIKHCDCPHDPEDHQAYAKWVMNRAEALIAVEERAMEKYDTMESLE